MILKTWIETLFPPLCAICDARCDTKLLCPSCWSLCAPPDPVGRCPHCFEESAGMCKQCRQAPQVPFQRASVFEPSPPALYLAKKRPDLLAAFAVVQWIQLDWPTPDAVVPMWGAQALASEFAAMAELPFCPILKKGRCNVEAMEPDQIVLLIDHQRDLEEAAAAIALLDETFLKKGFLLSLFPYDNFDSRSDSSRGRDLFGSPHRSTTGGLDRSEAGQIPPPP